MKNNILKTAIIVLTAFAAVSCDLHEEPERTADGELGVDPTQVVLNTEITLNLELPGTDETFFPLPDTVMHRFVVEAYNRDREVVNRQVLYDKDLSARTFSLPVSMRLHATAYRIVVWSDYVRISDPDAQLYYNADILTPVINNGNYRGCANAKDTFSGYIDIDLLPYADEWNARVDAAIELKRPMGRYEIVATDVEAFNRRVAAGTVKGIKFTARVSYGGYLAVGYNCYDQVRKHSLNYMYYTRTLGTKFDGTELTIGFDYIFTSPDETLDVPVEIEILNENNESVSRSAVTLPIGRNMNTVVRGRFLTSTADGGLNIDPGFDGDITIDMGTLTPTK